MIGRILFDRDGTAIERAGMRARAVAALIGARRRQVLGAADVISVPKGPGSIEGLGESFEANLNSGSVRGTVKIALPPGTNGLGPSFALSYDDHDQALADSEPI